MCFLDNLATLQQAMHLPLGHVTLQHTTQVSLRHVATLQHTTHVPLWNVAHTSHLQCRGQQDRDGWGGEATGNHSHTRPNSTHHNSRLSFQVKTLVVAVGERIQFQTHRSNVSSELGRADLELLLLGRAWYRVAVLLCEAGERSYCLLNCSTDAWSSWRATFQYSRNDNVFCCVNIKVVIILSLQL